VPSGLVTNRYDHLALHYILLRTDTNAEASITCAFDGVGQGQQKVTVEHVHVHEGGQAIVGMVEGGGGSSKKGGSTPCS
jgi:hypothetical protein